MDTAACIRFQYDRKLIEKFPRTCFGFVRGSCLQNPPSNDGLRKEFSVEQADTLIRLGQLSPAEIAPLAAWRRTFSAFGVSPTKYRCAAEALLRRLRKSGEIPTINTLVDIGNLVSLRHSLPVLVYDLSKTSGVVTVGFACGDETYHELHLETPVSPPEGEVIFADENRRVIARRWCWRQSAQSAVSEATSEAMFIVEAQHDGGFEDICAAVNDMRRLIAMFAGGNTEIVFGVYRASEFIAGSVNRIQETT